MGSSKAVPLPLGRHVSWLGTGGRKGRPYIHGCNFRHRRRGGACPSRGSDTVSRPSNAATFVPLVGAIHESPAADLGFTIEL